MCWHASFNTIMLLLGLVVCTSTTLAAPTDGEDNNNNYKLQNHHSASLHKGDRDDDHNNGGRGRNLQDVFGTDNNLFLQEGGGRTCGTPIMTLEEQAKSDEDFQAWQTTKANSTSLGLKVSSSYVDWSTATITIPTYFHVIYSGTEGQQFTYASNPAYIQDQIKTTNIGFKGENSAFPPNPNGRSYDRYSVSNADARIRFCLMGTTATDNVLWYNLSSTDISNEIAMKIALKKGGMETLNVYVNLPDGLLGYAYYAQDNVGVLDGIIILNDSMPGGAQRSYNQGDTLTHELGHWLNLAHTHDNGCSGPGDYMDIAPPNVNYTSKAAKEAEETFDCPVNLDNCDNDGGRKNPIHSFMSYVDDDCMDQFTPGQVIKMQQAWEMYRHKPGYSELLSVAEDGFSCVVAVAEPPTSKPTKKKKGAKKG